MQQSSSNRNLQLYRFTSGNKQTKKISVKQPNQTPKGKKRNKENPKIVEGKKS